MLPKDALCNVKRPKILLQAAKIGLTTYSRNRDLKRLFKVQEIPQPKQIIKRLLKNEMTLEEARRTGNAAYDMKKHIQVMTALLQEIYLLPKEH